MRAPEAFWRAVGSVMTAVFVVLAGTSGVAFAVGMVLGWLLLEAAFAAAERRR